MFRSNSRAHKALMVAAGIAAIAGTSATSAQAAKSTSTYDFACDMPLVGSSPFKVALSSTLPADARVGTPVASSTTATLTSQVASNGTDTGYTMFQFVSAKSVDGAAMEDANVALPGGGNLPIHNTLTVPSTAIPASAPIVLAASGPQPALTFATAGTATVTVSKINLNLTAYYADGNPIPLSEVQTYPDSDGNPNTFDAPCTPVNGPVKLATIKVKR